MKETTLDELHLHTHDVFQAVEEGETVQVLRDGKVVAQIVPMVSQPSETPAWKHPPKVQLTLDEVSLSGQIIADRDDRL